MSTPVNAEAVAPGLLPVDRLAVAIIRAGNAADAAGRTDAELLEEFPEARELSAALAASVGAEVRAAVREEARWLLLGIDPTR